MVVAQGAEVTDSVVFEDVYIERNARVAGAILDKRGCIGEGASVGGENGETSRESLTLIGTKVQVAPGRRIGPEKHIR